MSSLSQARQSFHHLIEKVGAKSCKKNFDLDLSLLF
jgi:hypothetical protein